MSRAPKSHRPPTGTRAISSKGSGRTVLRDSKNDERLPASSEAVRIAVAPRGSGGGLINSAKGGTVKIIGQSGHAAESTTYAADPLPPARREISWSEAADHVLDRYHDLFVKLADK